MANYFPEKFHLRCLMSSRYDSVYLIFAIINPLMSSVAFLYHLNMSENRRYKKVTLNINRLKSLIKSKTGFVISLSVLGTATFCYWLFDENILSFPDLNTPNNNTCVENPKAPRDSNIFLIGSIIICHVFPLIVCFLIDHKIHLVFTFSREGVFISLIIIS